MHWILSASRNDKSARGFQVSAHLCQQVSLRSPPMRNIKATSTTHLVMVESRTALTLLFLVGTATGAVDVIFNSIADDTLQMNSADCGTANSTFVTRSFSLNPNPILNPGSTYITASFDVLQKLPSNGLRLKLAIEKLEPRRMRIPCFRRFGSCTYDICSVITAYSSIFCPMFPSNVLCSCQLEAGIYNANSVEFALPNFGRIIRKYMQGNYTGNATIVDGENRALGCIRLQFRIQNRRDV